MMAYWLLNRWMVYLSNEDEYNFDEIVIRCLESYAERPNIPLVIYYHIIDYANFIYYTYDSNYPPTPTSDDEDEEDTN